MPKNEQIFQDVLPELCRVYEQTRFADSLNIFIRNVRIGDAAKEVDDDSSTAETIKLRIDGIECSATFESCQAVKQKRISEYDEMLFGIFGQELPKASTLSPELVALNARLILPKASDKYASHIELRNYGIPLSPSFLDIFACSEDEIRLSQKHRNELYLHVNLRKGELTSRSALFEAIFLMLQELGMTESITRISRICLPFVHFGRVRISVKIEVNTGNVRVEMFNLFGSLFGVVTFQDECQEYEVIQLFLTEKMIKLKLPDSEVLTSPVESDSPEEPTMSVAAAPEFSSTLEFLVSILQNQMNLLKNSENDIEFTPLPYLGVDSIRLAELEFYIADSPEYKKKHLKSPFLLPYKTLNEVAEFLDQKLEHELNIEHETVGVGDEALQNLSEISKFSIPLSSQQKRIMFVRELEMEQLKSDSTLISQFDELIQIRFSDVSPNRIAIILNYLIMRNSILRSQYLEDHQYLLSGTESFVAVRESEETRFPKSNTDSICAVQCALKSPSSLQMIFNHISIDGRSLSMFYKNFKELLSSPSLPIPAGVLQYYDYCKSQSVISADSQRYWKNYLDIGHLELHSFRTASSRTTIPAENQTASYIHRVFPASIQKKFDAFCLHNSLSRFELFFGLLEMSIRRVFVPTASFALGFAVDQRTFHFAETVGCFTNVLPYLSFPPNKEGVNELLKKCQTVLRESRSHAEVPYESIAKLYGGDLFQIFVVNDVVEVSCAEEEVSTGPSSKRAVRFEDEAAHFEVVPLTKEAHLKKIAKYPMTLYIRQFNKEGGDQLHVEIEFSQQCFEQEAAQNVISEIFRIINQLEAAGGGGSRRRRYADVSMSRSDFPKSTISQIISSSAHGSSIRFLQTDSRLQSSECSVLLLRAHLKLYGQLMTEHPIILHLARGPLLINAVLGAWKAGFYPIPLHRDAQDSQIENVCRGLGLHPKGAIVIRALSDLPFQRSQSETRRVFNRSILSDLAYVTCTSGSTGTPKLVGTSFEGHSNLARQYTSSFQLSARDTVGQVVDPSFDIFFADIVKTFVNGARLLLAGDAIATPSELLQCSNVYLMPAFLSRIHDMKCLNNLETCQYGGEPLAPQALRRVMHANRELRVWQEFGLTEQTVYSARRRIRWETVTAADSNEMRVIGEAFDNIRLEVDDGFVEPSAASNRGQLIVSGVGLMRGYFGVTSTCIHRFPTGDEVLRRDNGQMVFIGRTDVQVKIRGHRVDLFEIECVALSSNLIEVCSAIVDEKRQLVLFFKQKPSITDGNCQELLEMHLEEKLSSYQVPNKLIALAEFPLTRTGKIDKKRLISMADSTDSSTENASDGVTRSWQSQKSSEDLKALLKHWLEVFSNSTIPSENADVLACGVDSIAVMLTVQKLRKEKGVEIPVKVFFQLKTICKIVDWTLSLANRTSEITDINLKFSTDSRASINKEKPIIHYINLSHIQQRILFLTRMSMTADSGAQSPFRLRYYIPIAQIHTAKLTVAANTVLLGNRLLRGKLQRLQGEYKFIILSGTECFYQMAPRDEASVVDSYTTELWMDEKMSRLHISIHHMICDGRSLQILENQMSMILEDKAAFVKFQNHFIDDDSLSISNIPESLSSGIRESLFPAFKIGGKTSEIRIEFRFPSEAPSQSPPAIRRSLHLAYAYGKAIAHVFTIADAFPIATTFANRNVDNWETISMFANTLPLIFDKALSLEEFSQRFHLLAEHSSIPLSEVLKGGVTAGNFADFAINSHRNLDIRNDKLKNRSQFPVTLTFSEREMLALLEFDESCVTRGSMESLKLEILNFMNPATKPNRMNYVAAFQKFLSPVITQDTDFFLAGGNSLTAMRLIDYLSDKLQDEIPLKLIFEFRSPIALEKAVDQLRKTERITESSARAAEASLEESALECSMSNFDYPLSSQQLQMFYLSQLNSKSLEYQLPFIQPFPSIMAPSEIHRSLLMTIQQQPIFRTVLLTDPATGEPYQQVVSMTEAFLRCHVHRAVGEHELHQKLRDLCHESIDVLGGRPLLRATFVACSARNVAFLHLHHLISDARSTQLTNATMKEFLEDVHKYPKRQPFTYMDYCRRERSEVTDHSDQFVARHSQYFETLISGMRNWELVKSRRSRVGAEPQKVSVELPKILIEQQLSSRRFGGTPFSVFLHIISSRLWSVCCRNAGGSPNFNIAFPVMNRDETTANLCGYFLNNLIINTGNLSLLPTVLSSNLPYSDVVKEVRRVSGTDVPVADVYVNCRYDLEFDESDDEALLNLVPLKLHFPIEVDVDLLESKTYRITMRSNRLTHQEMTDILEGLQNELEGGNTAPSGDNAFNRRKYLQKVLYGHRKDVPACPLPVLYRSFFSSNHKSIFAISSASDSWSYGRAWRVIAATSSRLSREFLHSRGACIRSDDIIAVIGSKSIQTTIVCLATQLCGAAYLPIDESYPETRISQISRDAVFTFFTRQAESDSHLLPPRRHFCISSPHSLSYIITTSGTTGTPKSVTIEAESVANLCVSATLTMKISNSSRVFQFTNFVFDNSVLEVSMAVASQATLIAAPSRFDPSEFERSVEQHSITHCLLFPSLVQSFDVSKIRKLAYWIVGGERLPQPLLDAALHSGIHVIQNYGPTETTAFAVAKRMQEGDAGCQIGYPAINSMLRISRRTAATREDANGSDGSGELLIRGKGVMRGYLNRENTDVFEIIHGEKWYSTGDICEFNDASQVEFIGRTDSQIKIRGYRVELSEIERVIETLHTVPTCRALFDSDSQQIHVFFTAAALSSDNSEHVVRKHCERHLEPHKVPSTFNEVHDFPLTSNSKIDKVKLMELVKNRSVHTPSESCSMETELSSIWMTLLNCPKPSPSDHFFFIGGHSLLLIRLRHLIETRLHMALTVPEILENLTFSDMLELLNKKSSSADDNTRIADRKTLVVFPALYGGCAAYLKLIEALKTSNKSRFCIIQLEEESGGSVDAVAMLYRKQIQDKLSNASTSLSFIGASSAGAFAFATSQLFPEADAIVVMLLDSGTFWDEIAKLEYSRHEKETTEHLRNYEVDPLTAQRLADASWQVLQNLRHFKPTKCQPNVHLHVLSVNGSDLGWSKYSENVKVHSITGDHYSMLQNSEDVACIVKRILKILY